MTEAPSTPRRPYRKPVLTKVELRPEEAVLGHCKGGTLAGPLDDCASPSTCFDAGS